METVPKPIRFLVRELKTEADRAACLALDGGYTTDQVWQMDVREDGDDLSVRFRTVRLPRVMRVEYPRSADELAEAWKQRDCFLIATAEATVLGYVNMRVDASRGQGWIRDLVVGEMFRRRRIGSALLEQAMRWAALHRVRHLTLEMQTKNVPAITFARGHGFVFCGYNDRYYSNGDIALFFDADIP